MQRTQCSFYKERKRMQEHFVLLKRTQKNATTLRSFEKNGCPTLPTSQITTIQHMHKQRTLSILARSSWTSATHVDCTNRHTNKHVLYSTWASRLVRQDTKIARDDPEKKWQHFPTLKHELSQTEPAWIWIKFILVHFTQTYCSTANFFIQKFGLDFVGTFIQPCQPSHLISFL